MSGAIKDYKFGQKNNWRRSMWNEVLSRTAGREKHQPILYLAGSGDLDRPVATSKGVPATSLIAIDRSRQNVTAVRRSKQLAIHGDALDCLLSWPIARPVCAVLLDFCCGLEQKVMAKVYTAIERNPALAGATVMVNLQRGRDASTNEYRQGISEWKVQNVICRGQEFETSKHRGVQFVIAKAFSAAARRFLDEEDRGHETSQRVFAAAGGSDYVSLVNWYLARILVVTRPIFWSYRSGPLVFDSAVFTPLRGATAAFEREMVSKGHTRREINGFYRRYADIDMSRKIAAALAVRTMRGA